MKLALPRSGLRNNNQDSSDNSAGGLITILTDWATGSAVGAGVVWGSARMWGT
jgi:hypothetical protein